MHIYICVALWVPMCVSVFTCVFVCIINHYFSDHRRGTGLGATTTRTECKTDQTLGPLNYRVFSNMCSLNLHIEMDLSQAHSNTTYYRQIRAISSNLFYVYSLQFVVSPFWYACFNQFRSRGYVRLGDKLYGNWPTHALCIKSDLNDTPHISRQC